MLQMSEIACPYIFSWAGNISDDAVVLFLVSIKVESELHRQEKFQKVS